MSALNNKLTNAFKSKNLPQKFHVFGPSLPFHNIHKIYIHPIVKQFVFQTNWSIAVMGWFWYHLCWEKRGLM